MTTSWPVVTNRSSSPSGSKRQSHGSATQFTPTRTHISQHLSRRLPYYLTPEEAHKLIEAADNERYGLFLRLRWETGARVSEAIAIKLGDVSREGIRVLGKGSIERVVFIQEGLVSDILY